MSLYVLDTVPAGRLDAIDLKTYKATVVCDIEGVPDGVVVDPVSRRMYWTNMGNGSIKTARFFEDDGEIISADLDGKDCKVLAGGGSITTPKQIVLDDDYLYFGDREGMRVHRVRTDGTGLETLVTAGKHGIDSEDRTRHCVGVCTDAKYVYYTQKGPSKGGQGRIFRVPKEAKNYDPSNRSDIELLAADLPEPIDLLLAPSGKLYWTDRGAPPYGNSVNYADITPEGLKNSHVITTGFKEAIGLAMTADEKTVYVSDLDGNLYEVDIASGAKKVIHTGGRFTGVYLLE